jgi:fumarate reductase flavoprotein subunit
MKGIDRRDFLKGALVAGAASTVGVLAGCSPQAPKQDAETPSDSSGEKSYDISETRDVDVVVVGSGISGLAAAVESAELGARTLLLEKESVLGGNGGFTYGPSGFNTRYSRAAGVEFDYHDAVKEEQQLFNYIPNVRYYIDMAEASSDNIDWVAEHGVAFLDVVDNYKGGNPTAHYWAGESDPALGRIGYGGNYVSGMQAAAEAAGVEILLGSPAVDVVMDGSDVVGVIAQQGENTYLQVNAKAVIIGTGGWCANRELLSTKGRGDEVIYAYTFNQGMTGDGWALAMKAGAFDTSDRIGFIEQPAFAEMGLAESKANIAGASSDYYPNRNDNHPVWNILKMGKCIWVNEEGERFADESCGRPEGGVAGWATCAITSQRRSYAVIDKALIDMLGKDCMDFLMSANEHNTKFQADTIEELAASANINVEGLKAAIERYNGFCEQGADIDFGKHAEALVPLGEGPYFATQLGVTSLCSIGGVRITRQMQAADKDWNPIKGLYVIGVDSFPFYTQMYYFQLPGSACAFELHSGLVAARHAAGTLA